MKTNNVLPKFTCLTVPAAPRSITKGSCLADLLDNKAVAYLARNIQLVYGEFKTQDFLTKCEQAPQNLALMARAHFIAKQLHQFLPNHYSDAIEILTNTLIDCDEASEEFGLDKFFYLPHSFFIAEYGRDARFNSGHDPFDISIAAQYQLTQRFSAEFCIRPFLIEQQERTLEVFKQWQCDPNRHIRRLVSEGSRPKLPWGKRLPQIIEDPSPVIPFLDQLKNDTSLYVRRSVANSLGDIAKDHKHRVFELVESWIPSADTELKWLIRHAVRYYAKKKDEHALAIRNAAK